MDFTRIRRALTAVNATRKNFDELAQRSGELDEQLTELPEPPRLGRWYLLLLVLALLAFGGLIGFLVVNA